MSLLQISHKKPNDRCIWLRLEISTLKVNHTFNVDLKEYSAVKLICDVKKTWILQEMKMESHLKFGNHYSVAHESHRPQVIILIFLKSKLSITGVKEL